MVDKHSKYDNMHQNRMLYSFFYVIELYYYKGNQRAFL